MLDQLPKHDQCRHYIFLDEVGRGCLAGPVVVGGILWNPKQVGKNDEIPSWKLMRQHGVDDSKKVPEVKRQVILKQFDLDPLKKPWDTFTLAQDQFFITLDQAEVIDIEEKNILRATMLLMQKVVFKLCHQAELLPKEKIQIFIDGREKIPGLENSLFQFSQVAMPKADSLFAPMGLASLFAKVYRDHQMQSWHKIYPQFELGKHKGYGTAKHLSSIKEFGPSPIHRKTFAGVKEFLSTGPNS